MVPSPATKPDSLGDDDNDSPVTPSLLHSHSAPAGLGLGIPSLLRTPPSTIDLLPSDEQARDSSSNSRQSLAPPPRAEEGNNNAIDERRSSPPSSSTYSHTTFPFPKMKSSEMLAGSEAGSGSYLSERPDTLPSLLGPPRGRRLVRPSNLSRRTSSDPQQPIPELTQTVSRDAPSVANSNSQRVSFESKGAGESAGTSEKPDFPKKLQTSLERFKQMIRHPASDPVLPLHHRTAQTQTTNPPPSLDSRAQSPNRGGLLYRNLDFWPSRSPHEEPWQRPCDPYSSDSPRVSRLRSKLMQRRRHRCSGDRRSRFCGLAASLPNFLRFEMPSLDFLVFWVSITVRQIYRHILLRLPSLYFARVWRIIFEAQVSKPEIERMIRSRNLGRDFPIAVQWVPPVVPPGLSRFKNAWEDFVETLLKEWKTLNVVSALLLSAILTIFQINGTDQPVTRTAALCSLVCALVSLIYGCVYVVRFTAMKDMTKAARWAEEAQKDTAGILWNVWVFLSLPAIFLAYSVLFFCVAIMSYIWTTGTDHEPSPIPSHIAFIPRTIITVLFCIGILYFYLIIQTFQSYADEWPVEDDTPVQDQTQVGQGGTNTNNTHIRNNNPYLNGLIVEDREARERRESLRRFGIPDVGFPSPPRRTMDINAMPNGGNGVEKLVGNLGSAGVVSSGGPGGFVPRPVVPTDRLPSTSEVQVDATPTPAPRQDASISHPLIL
ncbi:hypothetical protein FRC02_008027 [Tulasnella sp. 418]|nr:hypothetical protein FRC02_008027 [Tulasnella sp. 418]